MPEDDHQFLQDQSRPHYGYSSLPRMSMPPHGGEPRYPLPPPHHHRPHHIMGAPPPPGYPLKGPAHPHHMPPFPSKHNIYIASLKVSPLPTIVSFVICMCIPFE